MFLVSWRLEPFKPGITVSGLSRSRDHLDDLIGDIVGALLSAILPGTHLLDGQKLFVVPWQTSKYNCLKLVQDARPVSEPKC